MNSAARGTMMYGAIVRYPPGIASACFGVSATVACFAEFSICELLSKFVLSLTLKSSRGRSRRSRAILSSGATLGSKSSRGATSRPRQQRLNRAIELFDQRALRHVHPPSAISASPTRGTAVASPLLRFSQAPAQSREYSFAQRNAQRLRASGLREVFPRGQTAGLESPPPLVPVRRSVLAGPPHLPARAPHVSIDPGARSPRYGKARPQKERPSTYNFSGSPAPCEKPRKSDPPPCRGRAIAER